MQRHPATQRYDGYHPSAAYGYLKSQDQAARSDLSLMRNKTYLMDIRGRMHWYDVSISSRLDGCRQSSLKTPSACGSLILVAWSMEDCRTEVTETKS